MAERPTVVAPEGLAPRDLVFGLSVNGIDRAIPASLVQGSRVFVDAVGDVPILLLVSADGLAVRAFDARNRGTEIELFAREGATTWIDSGGQAWGFEGCTTVAGERGDCLKPIAVVRSYWFDWRGQHPETTLARAPGLRPRP